MELTENPEHFPNLWNPRALNVNNLLAILKPEEERRRRGGKKKKQRGRSTRRDQLKYGKKGSVKPRC